MNSKRQKAEELIYKVYDTVDPTHTNSDYYRKIFADMSDSEFEKFCSGRLPFRFHEEVFKIEPKMYQIFDAFKILDKPLVEKVNMPHVYRNKDGVPVQTQDALIIYINIKRMKQMLTKKNNTAIDIENRDMKTGLLTGKDKGGKETDREFMSLATMGMEYTMDEFARPKADAMNAMQQMSNTILSKGYVSDDDINVAKNDSIGKNLLNVYLMGAHIHSNLIDVEYMTPLTSKNKQVKIERK